MTNYFHETILHLLVSLVPLYCTGDALLYDTAIYIFLVYIFVTLHMVIIQYNTTIAIGTHADLLSFYFLHTRIKSKLTGPCDCINTENVPN